MAKNPGHRPRRNTPEQVRKAVDQMIRTYRETGDVDSLTDFALLDILGNISPRTLERYYDGSADKALQDADSYDADTDSVGDNSIKEGYGDALKRLVEFRRATCVSHIASGGASTTITGWIFLSKQPHWGGFQDIQRVEKTGNQSFSIQLLGADGKPLRE